MRRAKLVKESLNEYMEVSPEGSLYGSMSVDYNDLMDIMDHTAGKVMSPEEAIKMVDLINMISDRDLAVNAFKAMTSYHPYMNAEFGERSGHDKYEEAYKKFVYHFFPEEYN